ncbi:hypothetical protein MPER_07554 [Moniliophthora perniciosa FA553]|nr:hypothetical protein MPER_07554 [Moniliophthora perniciosa FA553]
MLSAPPAAPDGPVDTATKRRWLEDQFFERYWVETELPSEISFTKKSWIDKNVLTPFVAQFNYGHLPRGLFYQPVTKIFTNAARVRRVKLQKNPNLPPPYSATSAPSATPVANSGTTTSVPGAGPNVVSTVAPTSTPIPAQSITAPTSTLSTVTLPAPAPAPSHSVSTSQLSDTPTPTSTETLAPHALSRATNPMTEWTYANIDAIKEEVQRLAPRSRGGVYMSNWNTARNKLWSKLTEAERQPYEQRAGDINTNRTLAPPPEHVTS